MVRITCFVRQRIDVIVCRPLAGRLRRLPLLQLADAILRHRSRRPRSDWTMIVPMASGELVFWGQHDLNLLVSLVELKESYPRSASIWARLWQLLHKFWFLNSMLLHAESG